jgi:hypothetical protein
LLELWCFLKSGQSTFDISADPREEKRRSDMQSERDRNRLISSVSNSDERVLIRKKESNYYQIVRPETPEILRVEAFDM